MKIRTVISFVVILTLTSLLTACSRQGRIQDLQNYINHLKQAKLNKPVTDINFKLNPPKAVIYQEQQLRSPFDENSETQAQKDKGLLTPLETYSLSSLQFVGTITEQDVLYGYIMAPDNKIYSVKIGDKIGDHHGIVKSITGDRLEVTERTGGMENDKTTLSTVVVLQLKEEPK